MLIKGTLGGFIGHLQLLCVSTGADMAPISINFFGSMTNQLFQPFNKPLWKKYKAISICQIAYLENNQASFDIKLPFHVLVGIELQR